MLNVQSKFLERQRQEEERQAAADRAEAEKAYLPTGPRRNHHRTA